MKKKEHNISAIIMLVAGAVAVLCCLINRVPILQTLKYLLVVLILFLIIGRIAEGIIGRMNAEVEAALALAEEEAKAAKEQAEKEEAKAEVNALQAEEDEIAKSKGA